MTTLRRFYFENSILCFECTGMGCKQCLGTGIESLSEFMSHTTGDVLSLTIQYYQSKKLLKP